MTKPSDFISVDALELIQNGQKFYVCGLTAQQISATANVNMRDPAKDTGYQRLFVEAHIKGIKKFLESGNCIPVSVLVTFKGAQFLKGKLKLKNGAKNGWIIDGQHRWLAAKQMSKEIVLPVIAFIDLPISKQIEHFVTINREAKGVPSSLYLDLLKSLPKEKTIGDRAKERATDLARLLATDEESPFYGKIVTLTSPKKGEISLTNFVRKATTLIKKGGVLAPFKVNNQTKIVSNYFNGILDAYPTEADNASPIFFQTLGFGAFMDFFPVFFSTLYPGDKSFTRDQVRAAFDSVKIDFENWRQMGTGTQAEGAAATELESQFHSSDNAGVDSQIKL